MLVLTRKKGQSLVIGNNIEITIVDIQGDQVRIGINAPKSVTIHRKEVFEEIKSENVSAVVNKQTELEAINLKFRIEKQGEQT